ncbi:MAG: FAD-dependent monooxygenase [Rhizobiales bacterium]|nr:FAD-dependent monooxygenase [Hyphomicrobiales bacterium]
MHIAILGAGPAGLYLAYLLKRRAPATEIAIFEQNRADATFGFGVVFSDRALEFLQGDDPETFAAITPHLETWDDITLVHRGERIRIDGIGFAAIGRLKLLQLLQARVRSVGVNVAFERRIENLDSLSDFDLVVGADGVNSLVRRTHEQAFGATHQPLSNRFAWFGTNKPFATLTQTFRAADYGYFNAHHYRFAPAMSTFIVEVDEPTFRRAGFDRMQEDNTRAVCERVFADDLEGHSLISNNSIWRQFPKIWNERWSYRNMVLIGDALRTAHFSIGSGTRLAIEDAIALDKALAVNDNISKALAAYERARRPIVEKLVAGANASADWYENFAAHMALVPIDFAMSYVMRSGRIDPDRLRRLSPDFMRCYEQVRPGTVAPLNRDA